MLNISGIHEGFVLDHIKAGMSLQIYHDLKLDELDCTVAIIKNAKSSKMGKKDILKVECPVEALDLDILGFIDHNITVNVIKDDKIYEKKELHLPKQVKNVITCRNPRCITSIEQELDQIFLLTDEEKETMCDIVCEAGADYIKTSTGFSTAGANFHDVELMVKGVHGRCKVKAAGGISTVEDMEKFLALGADRLGTSRAVKILNGEQAKGY